MGYNAQVAFDAKHKLIVGATCSPMPAANLGLLAPTAGAAKEVLGVERIEALADKGYYKQGHPGVRGTWASRPTSPGRSAAERYATGCFAERSSAADPTSDTYRCPGGQQLHPLYRCIKGNHSGGPLLQSRCMPGL